MPPLNDQLTAILATRNLDAEDLEIWQRNFDTYYADVQDVEKAAMLADGAVARARMGLAVKSGDVFVEGWAILFSDAERKDLQGTFFDKDTVLLLDQYANAPLWIEHENGNTPAGERSGYEVHASGVWLEHKLFPEHPAYARIIKQVERGELSYSTDSMGHYAGEGYEDITGRLGIWPAAGCSLTTSPAEPGLGRCRIKRNQPMNTDGARSAVFVDGTQARDAHGAIDLSQKRDAEDETEGTLVSNHNQGSKALMNPEQLQALVEQFAAALGVEPSLEAVIAAMQQLASGAQPAEGEAVMNYDPAGLRSALGLKEDATDEDVAEELKSIVDLLQPAGAAAARSFDPQGFASARAALVEAAKSAPAEQLAIPYVGTGNARKNASPRYGSINVNRGAPKPTVDTLVKGILSGDSKAIKSATKAQGTSENVLGGYLVSEVVAEQILEPLYNQPALTQAGMQVVQMESETMRVTKNIGGSTAYWVGEHQTVADTDVTFGVVNLVLKELVAENRYSQRSRRYARGLENAVQNDMRTKMSLAIDLAGLRGSGGSSPRGIRYDIPSTGVTSLASTGRAPSIADINKAAADIAARNVASSSTWGIIASTRERRFLTGLTDTTGRPLLRDNWAGESYPDIVGLPLFESNQVPTNIAATSGSNTDTSEIYVGDFQFCVCGIGMDIEVAVDESVYRQERDILVQMVAYVDFGIYYREAFQVLTNSRGIISA